MRVRTRHMAHSFSDAITMLLLLLQYDAQTTHSLWIELVSDSFILLRQYDTFLLLQYDTQTTHGLWIELVSDSFILLRQYDTFHTLSDSFILLRQYDTFLLLQYDTHSLWIELVSDSFILLTPSFCYANMIHPLQKIRTRNKCTRQELNQGPLGHLAPNRPIYRYTTESVALWPLQFSLVLQRLVPAKCRAKSDTPLRASFENRHFLGEAKREAKENTARRSSLTRFAAESCETTASTLFARFRPRIFIFFREKRGPISRHFSRSHTCA